MTPAPEAPAGGPVRPRPGSRRAPGPAGPRRDSAAGPVPGPTRSEAGRTAGFALPAVLWVLVVVGAAAASYLHAARAERRAVAAALEGARARWAARAAFARAAAVLDTALSSATAAGSLRGAGDTLLGPVAVRLNGAAADAVLVDARARLHLGGATEEELAALLQALGASPGRARRLAAALADWRDPDDRARTGGRERDLYEARGLPGRPRNGPFASAGEIDGVSGMDAATAAALRRHVTVVGDGRINLNAAPVPVLATLPGLDASTARAVVSARRDGPLAGLHAVLRALPPEAARRVERRRDAFEDRAAYGPRHAELLVNALPAGPGPAGRIRATVELEGGRAWKIVRVVER